MTAACARQRSLSWCVLAALWVAPFSADSDSSPPPLDGQPPPTTARRLLLVTVPENGNVSYAEHHTAPPLQPINLLGQAIFQAAQAANERTLNRLNAEQSPIIAKSLADYDFAGKIVDIANGMASKNAWLNIGQVVVKHDVDSKATEGLLATSDSEALVRLACLYRFPLQFDALMVRCTFGTVFKAGAKSGSPSEASDPQLGARTFEIYVPLEHSYMPPAQKNAERWLDQSGALARKALDMAIARLPDVLDSGLATVPVPPGTPVRNVKRVGHYSGDAIKQDSTGSLVSLGGTIWSYEFSHGVDR